MIEHASRSPQPGQAAHSTESRGVVDRRTSEFAWQGRRALRPPERKHQQDNAEQHRGEAGARAC